MEPLDVFPGYLQAGAPTPTRLPLHFCTPSHSPPYFLDLSDPLRPHPPSRSLLSFTSCPLSFPSPHPQPISYS